MFYGLTVKDIRRLAFKVAKFMKIDYPLSWNKREMASTDWYYAFMNRNDKLSLRAPRLTSANRIKSFTKANVNEFFGNLSDIYTKYPDLTSKTFRVWNMDETNLSTVPSKNPKVVAETGTKRVGLFAAAERGTNVTVALAVSIRGECIPPFYIYPRKNMSRISYLRGTLLLFCIPSFLFSLLFTLHLIFIFNLFIGTNLGTDGCANGSGWMTQADFLTWLKHFIRFAECQKGKPTLLIMDNHLSHMNWDAIKLATDNDIILLTIPPHCTDRMQPLDTQILSPVKKEYGELVVKHLILVWLLVLVIKP